MTFIFPRALCPVASRMLFHVLVLFAASAQRTSATGVVLITPKRFNSSMKRTNESFTGNSTQCFKSPYDLGFIYCLSRKSKHANK